MIWALSHQRNSPNRDDFNSLLLHEIKRDEERNTPQSHSSGSICCTPLIAGGSILPVRPVKTLECCPHKPASEKTCVELLSIGGEPQQVHPSFPRPSYNVPTHGASLPRTIEPRCNAYQMKAFTRHRKNRAKECECKERDCRAYRSGKSGLAEHNVRMTAFAIHHRAFISRIFHSGCNTFIGRLANAANFVFASGIPRPLRDSMKTLDANLETRFGFLVR